MGLVVLLHTMKSSPIVKNCQAPDVAADSCTVLNRLPSLLAELHTCHARHAGPGSDASMLGQQAVSIPSPSLHQCAAWTVKQQPCAMQAGSGAADRQPTRQHHRRQQACRDTCVYIDTTKHVMNPLLLPAGIIAEEVVEPLPPALVALSRRLVRWADADVLLVICVAHAAG